jgi:hypothetical protein
MELLHILLHKSNNCFRSYMWIFCVKLCLPLVNTLVSFFSPSGSPLLQICNKDVSIQLKISMLINRDDNIKWFQCIIIDIDLLIYLYKNKVSHKISIYFIMYFYDRVDFSLKFQQCSIGFLLFVMFAARC